MRIFVVLAVFASAVWAQAPNVAGDWIGTLEFGVQKLRLIYHIKAGADGKLTATADSPDQSAKDMPVPLISLEGSTLNIGMPQIAASFTGNLAEDGKEIKGTFKQGTAEVPLVLRKMSQAEIDASTPKRPQIPVKPYPYEEQDVTFDNKAAAGVHIAGTLTIPKTGGTFPAVVLITGSGPQTRDQNVFGHPTFLVLSDYLTRKGFMVLRCDDRGVGKSTGVFDEATTADFASDAAAAVEFLKSHPKVDKKKIGLIGHSEGGAAAPIAASTDPDVAFVVLLAPGGVPGGDLIVAQKEAILKASGVADPDLSADRAVYAAILAGKSRDEIRSIAAPMFGRAPAAVQEQALNSMLSPWFRYFLEYNPATTFEKLKIPALILFGEKDLQVLPAQNVSALRAAAKKSGNQNVTIEVLPGLNHLFQMATTGLVNEYGKIEETISPVALKRISDWLAKNTGK